MKKLLTIAILGALMVPAAAQPGRAPDKDAAPASAAAGDGFLLDVKDATAKTGRVPNGYGKLGLTKDQKEKIYGIQAAYAARLKELEAEMEQLKAEQGDQIKNVLNDNQKTQVERYEAMTASRKRAAE